MPKKEHTGKKLLNLRIGVVVSCQKLGIIFEIKWFKNDQFIGKKTSKLSTIWQWQEDIWEKALI